MFRLGKNMIAVRTALIAASAFVVSACSGPSQSSLNSLTGFTPDVTTIAGGLTGAPLIGSDQNVFGTQSTPINFTTNVAIDPQSLPLTYAVVVPPAHGTLTGCMNMVGSPNGGTRACTYTPTAAWSGTDTFTYKANDGSFDSATNATVTIFISGVAHAPTLAAISNQTVIAGNAITPVDEHDTSTGNDTDIDGDPILYSCIFSGGGFSNTDCSSLPGTESFNTGTGILAWTTSPSAAVANAPAIYTVSVTGSNNHPTPLTNTQSFLITVNPGAPILTPLVNKVFPINNAIQGTNVSYDVNNIAGGAPGNDTGMTYSCTFDNTPDGSVVGGANCSTLPGFISFSTSTGVLSWTPDSTADGPFEIQFSGTNAWGTGSTIVEVDVRLAFNGITSISNITGSSMQLNWSSSAGAAGGYNIFLVNSNGSLTLNQNVPGSGSTSAVVTGLSTSTSYTWRVRAIDALANPDNNTVNLTANTSGSTFGSIANLTIAEGGTLSTANLTCSDTAADTPVYSIVSQTDASGCSISAGSPKTVNCSPSYHTGHTGWPSTVTVQCAINSANLNQVFTVNVTDTNRAPSLAAISNQTITAGAAITNVTAVDSTASNDFDVDLDALAFSCTFSGGGFSAGTLCTSLPGTASFNTGTGVLSWTSNLAAAAGDVQTVYTVSVTASDQQSTPLTNTKTFTVTVNPSAPVLTTLANHLYPISNGVQGTNLSFDVNNIAAGSPGNDAGMTYACVYDTVIDGTVGAGTNCSSLPGFISFSTSTGILSWTPNTSAVGPFEIKFTGTNSGGSASSIVDVDVRLNFGGLTSISNITGSSMQLNWTSNTGATGGYNIFLVNANGSLTLNQNVPGAGSTSAIVSALSTSTSYTWRAVAIDALGNPDSNTANQTASTLGSSFSSIANISIAEGATLSTPNLACSDTAADTPVYSIVSQTGASNCSITGSPKVVTCTPGYHTAHASWTSTVTVQCTINSANLNQAFTVNVTDTNRAPNLAAISNQTVVAGAAITTITPLDSTANNDFDVDLDALLFSCTFSGGGFSAGTTCNLLPGTESFNTSTGVLNWTSSATAAVANAQTVYTISILANDQYPNASQGLTNTGNFTVTVNPSAPVLTTLTNHLYPANNGIQGTNLSFDVNNIAAGSPGNDAGMTYACVYDTVIDGVVGAGTNCSSLPGFISFSTSTGILSWTPNTSALGPYEIKFTGTNSGGSGSSIVDVDVRLNFAGISSISAITGTSMQLNWTAATGATGYNVYSVAANGSLTFNETISGGGSTSGTVTGLAIGTSYTWRVQAVDTLGNLDSNTVNSTGNTSGATFTSIANLAVAEGGSASTANLACSDTGSDTPAYTITSQSDATANCTVGGSPAKVTCAPSYHTGHATWTSSVVVKCTINAVNLNQTLTVNVSDTNRAPTLAAISNQTITAGNAITTVTPLDSDASNDFDIDLDPLAFSCTFSGGGFSAGTNCLLLPGTETFNAGTGALTWTSTTASAVANASTVYTVVITASDQQATPLTGTQNFTVTVNPSTPVLTTLTNHLYPNNGVQTVNLSFDVNNIAAGSPGNDTGMTYTCVYDTVIDGSVSPGTACTSLPGSVATFNTATGVLSWTPNSSALGPYEIKFSGTNSGGTASTIVDVDVRLNFAGLATITNITGTTMQLNWTAITGPTKYNVYSVDGSGNLTLNQSVNGAASNTVTITGLSTATTYKWRVQAVDVLGNVDNNTINVQGTTDSIGTFSAITSITGNENDAADQTAALSCTHGGSTPTFTMANQGGSNATNDANANCTFGGGTLSGCPGAGCSCTGAACYVTCAPTYESAHSTWSPNPAFTISCTIDAVVLIQNMALTVYDKNRTPALTNSLATQTIAATTAMTAVTVQDSNTSTVTTDIDGDTITYSCTFSGGGNSAGTACSSLPNASESFNTATGVLSWTPSVAAAVSNAVTTYTVTITGSDGYTVTGNGTGPSPGTGTTSYNVVVEPAIILTTVNSGSNFNFNTSPASYVNQASVNQFGSVYYNQYSTIGGTALSTQYNSTNCPTNPGVPCTYFQVQNNASGTPNTTNMLYGNNTSLDAHNDGCTFTGPGFSSATACSSLPSHYTNTIWNSTNGKFEWYPGPNTYGTYAITIKASLNCAGCGTLPAQTETFNIDIMPSIVTGNYVSATWYGNLAGYFDPQFIDGNINSTNGTWNQQIVNLASPASHGSFTAGSLTTAHGLTGDSTRTTSGAAGPYAIALDGSTSYLSLGTSFNTGGGSSASTYGAMIDGWFYPESVATTGQTLVSNLFESTSGSGTATVINSSSGIKIKQALDGSGKLVAQVGVGYDDVVMGDSPAIYWPMTDAAGSSTLADWSGSGIGATLVGAVATGNTSVGGPFPGTNFTGIFNSGGANSTQAVNYTKSTSSAISTFDGAAHTSIEFWYNQLAGYNRAYPLMVMLDGGGNAVSVEFPDSANTLRVYVGSANYVTLSGFTLNVSTWYHVVVTYDGTKAAASRIAGYINGTAVTATVAGGAIPATLPLTGGSTTIYVGGDFGPSAVVAGSTTDADDAKFMQTAFYTTTLTSQQVANHYNTAGKSAECMSSTILTNNNWYHIATWWDAPNTTFSFMINGEPQCLSVVNASTTYYTSTYANTNNMVVGADPNASNGNKWQGQLGDLRIYNQLALADDDFTAQTELTNFVNTRYKYGGPQEQLNSDGLLYAIDAASASTGVIPWPATGCPTSQGTMAPIGINMGLTATLSAQLTTPNGTYCSAAQGWQGTGTTAAPYNLNMNANPLNTTSEDYVTTSTVSASAGSSSFVMWLNFATMSNTENIIGSATSGLMLYPYVSATTFQTSLFIFSVQTVTSTPFTNNTWYQVAGTQNGTNNVLYMNGLPVYSPASAGAALTVTGIGKGGNWNNFSGSISNVEIYNRPLSAAEICTMYNLHLNRFQSTPSYISSGTVAGCNP